MGSFGYTGPNHLSGINGEKYHKFVTFEYRYTGEDHSNNGKFRMKWVH